MRSKSTPLGSACAPVGRTALFSRPGPQPQPTQTQTPRQPSGGGVAPVGRFLIVNEQRLGKLVGQRKPYCGGIRGRTTLVGVFQTRPLETIHDADPWCFTLWVEN